MTGLSWQQKIRDIHGPAGAAWLERLPQLLHEWSERWSLTLEEPFANLSYNYVAPGRLQDGTPVVLKASPPGREFRQEGEALRLFGGRGVARLLGCDVETGAMLLERALPGTLLADLPDEAEVTEIALTVGLKLWQPAPQAHTLTSVAAWARGLDRLQERFRGGCGPFPPALVERARGLFGELIDPETDELIHGDLHPENILRSQREPWLAIDPKGVVGSRLFDVAVLILNTREGSGLAEKKARVDKRIHQAAEMLSQPRRLIADWAFAIAVLSGWWSYEDHGQGWEKAFSLAEMLLELRPGLD